MLAQTRPDAKRHRVEEKPLIDAEARRNPVRQLGPARALRVLRAVHHPDGVVALEGERKELGLLLFIENS